MSDIPAEEQQAGAPPPPAAGPEIDYDKLAEALARKLPYGGSETNAPKPIVEQDAVSAQAFAHEIRSNLPELPEEGHVAEPTLGVGMAGEPVRELAKLAQACGVETYLRRGDNPGDVFTDELLNEIRALVGDRRGFITHVNSDVWRLLKHKAAGEQEPVAA